MFERFRIKTALRTEVVRLRAEGIDPEALARAELVFFEAAFVVAPWMKQRRWTAEQAMVHMVTDVLLEAEQQGNIDTLAQDDPPVHAAMRAIYQHVLARAEADPALAPCISRPRPGQSVPFETSREA